MGQRTRPAGVISMLMMKNERRPALQTLRGWAISVLPETGREEYDWRRTVQIRIPTRWR
ncbi:hypothetical protein V1290_000250 [Bradyrhizobium sp. AZCC 1578]|uniref:hypothetical protein n=1 Tax=Bradyrhizobium sp. AZCC 1578 TaxID=3117027 RepID=UPI002FF305C1